MTIPQIENMLDEIGLPYAYYSFNASGKKAVPPPYIVYLLDGTKNIKADNMVYNVVESYRLEFYTDEKDTVTERRIENILDENNVIWHKYETYIDDQSMFQITYILN